MPATETHSTTTWKIDPAHSAAEFKVKHMMIANVRGKLTGLSGTLELDEAHPAHSRVQARIPLAELSTGDSARDTHLKGADFFDAGKYPEFTFESTEVRHVGGDEYSVTGDLGIHGVKHQVTFKVEELSKPRKDPWDKMRVGLSATTRINRKDYGLSWNSTLESGGVLVGDQVEISLDVQFIKA